ncbi:MAG: ABC transporter permease [Bdellovibrionales bacterium]|nr:ABC transporter permease [Bdellovibrionales bacterium]
MNAYSPLNVVTSLSANAGLVYQLVKRDIEMRYKGSLLGLLWVFIQPLMMLSVYTFVFSVVFEAKWHTDVSNRGEFAIILFAGLIIFSIFSECVNRSPMLITGQVSYVKRVVFPLETLSWVALCSCLFHAAMSLIILVVAALFSGMTLPLTFFMLPIILLPLAFLTLGISWFLASLGVYVRDVQHIVSVLTTILLFLSPIFYPLSSVPEKFHFILKLSPLTYLIETGRQVMIEGRLPDWTVFLQYCAVCLLVAWLGFFWFQKTRKGFSDVL